MALTNKQIGKWFKSGQEEEEMKPQAYKLYVDIDKSDEPIEQPLDGGSWYKAIDVDPLLAEKDREIVINNALVDDLKDMVTEKDEEIERLRKDLDSATHWECGHENSGVCRYCHVQELAKVEDANAKVMFCNSDLNTWNTGLKQRVAELEAALRQQKDECERFHKPA